MTYGMFGVLAYTSVKRGRRENKTKESSGATKNVLQISWTDTNSEVFQKIETKSLLFHTLV